MIPIVEEVPASHISQGDRILDGVAKPFVVETIEALGGEVRFAGEYCSLTIGADGLVGLVIGDLEETPFASSPAQGALAISLGRVYVPPFKRVVGGETQNVDGYWRTSLISDSPLDNASAQLDSKIGEKSGKWERLSDSAVRINTPDGVVDVTYSNGKWKVESGKSAVPAMSPRHAHGEFDTLEAALRKGEKVAGSRLVSKLLGGLSHTPSPGKKDRRVLVLARSFVPPHLRVVDGETIRVDGYWRTLPDDPSGLEPSFRDELMHEHEAAFNEYEGVPNTEKARKIFDTIRSDVRKRDESEFYSERLRGMNVNIGANDQKRQYTFASTTHPDGSLSWEVRDENDIPVAEGTSDSGSGAMEAALEAMEIFDAEREVNQEYVHEYAT